MVDHTKLHTGVFATPIEEKDTTEETVKYNPPRPFVYVPAGFDLDARGAIGQVLEALGVKEALKQPAPSMVLRVSKATKPPVDETAEEVAAAKEKREKSKSKKTPSEESEKKPPSA